MNKKIQNLLEAAAGSGVYIILPYVVDQNEPSQPLKELINATSEKELRRKMEEIAWPQIFEKDEEGLKWKRGGNWSDFTLSDQSDSLFLFATRVDKSY